MEELEEMDVYADRPPTGTSTAEDSAAQVGVFVLKKSFCSVKDHLYWSNHHCCEQWLIDETSAPLGAALCRPPYSGRFASYQLCQDWHGHQISAHAHGLV